MSQIFNEKGNVVPATIIKAGPCYVTQIKTKEKDGYSAVQIGFIKKTRKIKKTEKGKEYRYIREFRIVKEDKSSFPPSPLLRKGSAGDEPDGSSSPSPLLRKGSAGDEPDGSSSPSPLLRKGSAGDEPDGSSSPSPLLRKGSVIDVSIFKEGDRVKVSGITKGKGFQGAVKRWGFSGMGASHGVKHEHRTLGSVGSSFPERVIKGKKMPGRMGSERVTVKNLKIVKIDKENNILAIKGTVSGAKGTLLEIRSLTLYENRSL